MSIHASNPQSNLDRPAHRVGFFGESSVGKTTVSALVADRLSERGQVTVLGEASDIVESDPIQRPSTSTGLKIRWTIQDAEAGITSFEKSGPEVDTAFAIATPDRLDSVSAYERIANQTETDLFLIVTRFTEADRERVRAFDGPELAEYFYEDEAINTAIAANRVPSLTNWAVEAILVEALQPERFDLDAAFTALETKQRSIVNIEVDDEATAAKIVRFLRLNGFLADFLNCNCQCHDGHVIARLSAVDTVDDGNIGNGMKFEEA